MTRCDDCGELTGHAILTGDWYRCPHCQHRHEDEIKKQDSLVERPKEGTWFRVAPELRQTCCECGTVHLWGFRIVDGEIEVKISLEK